MGVRFVVRQVNIKPINKYREDRRTGRRMRGEVEEGREGGGREGEGGRYFIR